MNDVFKQHGAFSWSELLVDNVEDAIAFYSEVIGWEIEEMELPQGSYYILKSNGTPVGGIKARPEGDDHVTDNWATYITVDDVDKTLAKAEAAGGKAVYPPMDVPGVGRLCAISDKGGAMVSIITYEEKE